MVWPLSKNMLLSFTAASSRPPGLWRRSSTSPRMPASCNAVKALVSSSMLGWLNWVSRT